MSDVIVIDDEPAPARVRKPRRAAANPIVIDISDDEAYTPTPKKARKPKQRQQAQQQPAAECLLDYNFEDEEQQQPKKRKQKQQKTQDKEPKQPKPKRQKKEPEEKRTDEYGRTVRYAQAPSQKIYERIQRALPGSAHRMFLINTKVLRPAGAQGGRAQQFAVLGATSNVYDVTISRQPHCSCPDHAKGNLCKHILFVMLRVLKLATNNPLVWQRALLTKEVEEVLSGAHSQSSDHLAGVLADQRVRQAYAAAAGEGDEQPAAAAAADGRRKPVDGAECPICYEELKEGGEPLVWCETCGNNIHKGCWAKWADTKRRNAEGVTCVLCRAPWHDSGAGAAAGAATSPGGYLNLASQSAAHQGGSNLEQLYGENAHWISFHQGYGGSRAGAARAWGGGYGRRR
ncbi:hypothetical protein OEZ86_008965 [Tetradesmus obliquus]|nr:hypothetical protein OEZ86_008965 [Tetradesmus obliquus]